MSDIKNLKDLCKLTTPPLLCACYITQSYFSLKFGGYIFSIGANGAEAIKKLKAVVIFAGEIIYSVFI